MRFIIAFAALASACACSTASGAILLVEPAFSPNGVYSFYLDGQSTIFNGLAFSVKHGGGVDFLNVTSGLVAGAPRPAGQAFTYRNRLLDADPLDIPESKGWTLLGVVNTPQEIAFSGGPLGQTINTASEPGGKLFLANIMVPPRNLIGLRATVELVNGTDTVHSQEIVFFPEPGTIALALTAALGLAAARRRGPRLSTNAIRL